MSPCAGVSSASTATATNSRPTAISSNEGPRASEPLGAGRCAPPGRPAPPSMLDENAGGGVASAGHGHSFLNFFVSGRRARRGDSPDPRLYRVALACLLAAFFIEQLSGPRIVSGRLPRHGVVPALAAHGRVPPSATYSRSRPAFSPPCTTSGGRERSCTFGTSFGALGVMVLRWILSLSIFVVAARLALRRASQRWSRLAPLGDLAGQRWLRHHPRGRLHAPVAGNLSDLARRRPARPAAGRFLIAYVALMVLWINLMPDANRRNPSGGLPCGRAGSVSPSGPPPRSGASDDAGAHARDTVRHLLPGRLVALPSRIRGTGSTSLRRPRTRPGTSASRLGSGELLVVYAAARRGRRELPGSASSSRRPTRPAHHRHLPRSRSPGSRHADVSPPADVGPGNVRIRRRAPPHRARTRDWRETMPPSSCDGRVPPSDDAGPPDPG